MPQSQDLQNPRLAQLLKIFLTFYGIQSFITSHKAATVILSQMNRDHITSSYFCKTHFNP
jgi:hypothetical protein